MTRQEQTADATSSLDVVTPAVVRPDRSRRVIPVLAVATGLAVANIYYSQPLLGLISSAFGVSEARTELVVTLTQLGYAIGLFLLVPLGDLLENRAFASRTLLLTAAALLAAGLSPDFGFFLAMSVLVGITSMVAQVLVPLAAHLAAPHERGKVVGTVMAGLLLGILLARTISSLVAAAWGWRTSPDAAQARARAHQQLPAAHAVDPSPRARGTSAAAPCRMPGSDVRDLQLLLDLGGIRTDPAPPP
jgi:MFS family permease